MAVPKSKHRAVQFRDPDEKPVKDYDPEANGTDNDGDSDVSVDADAGTEHYESVGKGKLRQGNGLSLGPRYRGSRVSRKALEEPSDEEEDDDEGSGSNHDDPELADLEADEAMTSDSEIAKPVSKHGNRPRAVDFMSSDEDGDEDEDEEMDGGAKLGSNGNKEDYEEGSEDDEDMSDGLEALADDLGEDDDGSISHEEEQNESEEEDDQIEPDSDDGKALPIRDAKASVTSAHGQQSDITKGLAIQQQRKIYDGLLNIRIRLQKALIAANTFSALDDAPEADSEPYEAAEEAAIKLLNTITTLKADFGPNVSIGQKRRRTELEIDTPTQTIWKQLQFDESQLTRMRKETLERWSRKVQAVNSITNKSRFTKEKTLIDALEEQLQDPTERLAKRTRMPRSCAPVQASKGIREDKAIYDDADFYQQLLKELVEQRTIDGVEHEASAVPTVMLTAANGAKLRKNVDRKASKGRKMRFTVHEKLQNFMAPEDRRTWEQPAIDRFFGTLFGQKLGLNEEESEDEEIKDLKAQAESVRLFG